MATISSTRVVSGKTSRILDTELVGSGTQYLDFSLDDSDSILLSLYLRSVTSGSVDVVLYTVTITGEQVPVITFPTVTAPSTELLLKKAAVGLNNMRLSVTHTGDAEVSIYAKGIQTGEASVRILGASAIKTSQIDASAISPTLLVPAALQDRAGMVIKNNSLTDKLYIGESTTATTLVSGYPMGPGEAMGVDVAAGVAIYGLSDGSTIDVRILEADS